MQGMRKECRIVEMPGQRVFHFFKRCVDIVVSGFLLAVLSPFFLLISFWVKSGSRGPAIYRQQRCGRRGRRFTIYKFRSMVENAESGSPMLAVPDDPRVTGCGRFLRRYHLDELPQLWNILKGDMSLVGPRPERPFFTEKIKAIFPEYSMLESVRPGLTSLGMVRYGYASDIGGMVERARIELSYLSGQTVKRDVGIIMETVRTVFEGKGI